MWGRLECNIFRNCYRLQITICAVVLSWQAIFVDRTIDYYLMMNTTMQVLCLVHSAELRRAYLFCTNGWSRQMVRPNLHAFCAAFTSHPSCQSCSTLPVSSKVLMLVFLQHTSVPNTGLSCFLPAVCWRPPTTPRNLRNPIQSALQSSPPFHCTKPRRWHLTLNTHRWLDRFVTLVPFSLMEMAGLAFDVAAPFLDADGWFAFR